MHLCTKYGNIIIKYATHMTITLVFSLERDECLTMTVHYVNLFFLKYKKYTFGIFTSNSIHERTPCKIVAFFYCFYIYFNCFTKWGEHRCRNYSGLGSWSSNFLCSYCIESYLGIVKWFFLQFVWTNLSALVVQIWIA